MTDFASDLGDENYEDFEVDDDTSEKEIEDVAADIAFEHFSYSFWEINEEDEK